MVETYVILLVIVRALVVANAEDYKRVCYYTNWSQYRPGLGKYTPAEIDPHLCSHIVVAFAKLEGNSIKPLEWNDEATWSCDICGDSDESHKGRPLWGVCLDATTPPLIPIYRYKQINALKKVNKDLKTMVAIGGWNARSEGFSKMVSSLANRQAFLRTTVNFLRRYDFDGLDLDWEYPTKRGGQPKDRERFALLVKELKKGFINEAMKVGKAALLLTAAVPVGKDYIDSGYDVPNIAKYLDFINLMAYDIHGAWEKVTGENAPLYPRASETGAQRYLNVMWAANYWVDKGTPRRKLVIGLPTYGRSFTLKSETEHGLGAPASGPGLAGKYTRESGFLSFYEICLMQSKGGKTFMDSEQKVPYYVNERLWVGFDNEASISLKTEWIKQNGFGGAMIWSLDLDDFGKACPTSGSRYPLLTTINRILNGSTLPTTTSGSTSSSVSSTSGSTTPSTSVTTTTSTPKPESFSCKTRRDGFYPDPKTKRAFYRCARGIAYHFKCPIGTVYDPRKQCCTWPVLNVTLITYSAWYYMKLTLPFCMLS